MKGTEFLKENSHFTGKKVLRSLNTREKHCSHSLGAWSLSLRPLRRPKILFYSWFSVKVDKRVICSYNVRSIRNCDRPVKRIGEGCACELHYWNHTLGGSVVELEDHKFCGQMDMGPNLASPTSLLVCLWTRHLTSLGPDFSLPKMQFICTSWGFGDN